MKKKIETEKAPKAIGPYSQAVKINSNQEILFLSGQIPLDPQTGKLIEGDIRAMTNRVLDNLEAVLHAGGSSFDQVVRVDIFLKDLKKDFAAVNEEYAKRFKSGISPARQTVQAAELPLGSLIEISCIAYS